jgi:hypothetical protein
VTIDAKAPFPLEELYRQARRGVDHARRLGRAERGGMNHTVTTCEMSVITFLDATTAGLAVTHGHPVEPCITLSPRLGGNLLFNFIM